MTAARSTRHQVAGPSAAELAWRMWTRVTEVQRDRCCQHVLLGRPCGRYGACSSRSLEAHDHWRVWRRPDGSRFALAHSYARREVALAAAEAWATPRGLIVHSLPEDDWYGASTVPLRYELAAPVSRTGCAPRRRSPRGRAASLVRTRAAREEARTMLTRSGWTRLDDQFGERWRHQLDGDRTGWVLRSAVAIELTRRDLRPLLAAGWRVSGGCRGAAPGWWTLVHELRDPAPPRGKGRFVSLGVAVRRQAARSRAVQA